MASQTAPEPATVHQADANENPYPPPPAVVDAIVRAAGNANRYPEVYPQALADAIAAHHGVPAEHVTVGAGGAGLIQQMLHLVAKAKGEALFAWRSFEGYPLIAQGMGVPVRQVPLRDHRHDLDAMLKAVRRKTKLIFVCNPNNPTGAGIREDELVRFLDRVSPRVFVVIDEVYREFGTDPATADGLRLYPRYPNVVVLRSFSKAYGLAGMRVGYAVGQQGPIGGLRGVTMPFLVSRPALEAAMAALGESALYEEQYKLIAAERDRVTTELRKGGLEVPDSEGNFVWLPLGAKSADFAAAVKAEGMAVHAFDGEGVRVTIGLPDSNDTLIRVATDGRFA
ncbi:MAG: histidinol-phosphate transaminase [Actinocatenispora sp.]